MYVYACMHEDTKVGTCACANLCTHVCLCVKRESCGCERVCAVPLWVGRWEARVAHGGT